jgi:Tfp pilus assembly protein PilF
MKRAFATSTVFLIALLSFAACRSGGGDLSRADTQRRFGVRMAKMNLWREATFRFRRATEIEPENAMAHNNLAVALEATGDFDAAAREYREALRLDRSNEYIQKNYSRFVEFTQKAKKRAPVTTAAAPATAPATTTAPPAEATAAPPAATVPETPPATPEAPPVTTTTTTTTPPEDGV